MAWSLAYAPRTIGTVFIVFDHAANRTVTSTKWKQEYIANSTMALHSRTDTNAAGTVTASMIDLWGDQISV